jgi:hypothetical protein
MLFESKHYIMHASYAIDGSNEYLISCSRQSHTNLILCNINHIIYSYFGDSVNALSLRSNDFEN